jgi:hypothetical protein
MKRVLEYEAEKEKLKPLLGQVKRQMSHSTLPIKEVHTTKNHSPPKNLDSDTASTRNLRFARGSTHLPDINESKQSIRVR